MQFSKRLLFVVFLWSAGCPPAEKNVLCPFSVLVVMLACSRLYVKALFCEVKPEQWQQQYHVEADSAAATQARGIFFSEGVAGRRGPSSKRYFDRPFGLSSTYTRLSLIHLSISLSNWM